MNSQKGFTLIELLIVIAIIAVLAVAFLPTLLGAPAKGRDTARIATLQKIQKVLVNANLEGKAYPGTSGAISAALSTGLVAPNDTWGGAYTVSFGGTLPVEPTSGKSYYYVNAPSGYAFGVWAQVENLTSGNANCTLSTYAIALGTPGAATATVVPCYAVLTQ